jgi:hypothetical protein
MGGKSPEKGAMTDKGILKENSLPLPTCVPDILTVDRKQHRQRSCIIINTEKGKVLTRKK